MAGNYPDVPSWRMAYDRDGTILAKIVSGVITQLTNADAVTLNNEADDSVTIVGPINSGSLCFIFPELRDLDGFLITSPNVGSRLLETSTNTTNGVDGTWTSLGSYPAGDVSVNPYYRSSISSVTALGVRAVRFTVTSGDFRVRTVHLYGEPAPGANPDRLEMWHPTLDEKLPPAYFDWGNVPRSSSADRAFRVKNLSAALTANTPRVAMGALTDATPSVPGQHLLSYNGGTFLAQVNIGTLAPGAISLPVTLRRSIASNAQLGLWAMRVFAEATSWS